MGSEDACIQPDLQSSNSLLIVLLIADRSAVNTANVKTSQLVTPLFRIDKDALLHMVTPMPLLIRSSSSLH